MHKTILPFAGLINIVKGIAVTVLFLGVEVCLGSAQNANIFIYDSNGNSTTGTITNGNLYLQDSKGNTAFGTIKNGHVFFQGSNGEIVIGTIRDGNVFLTDDKGVTTGTIRNGQIFLNSSDGSIITGTYNKTSVYTTTTSSRQDRARDDEEWERIRQQKQREAEAGAVVGAAIGSAIGGAIENHRINSYCKANPTSTFLTSDGIAILCPNAPLDGFEQSEIDGYCRDNPGSWMAIGKHRVDCLTPPSTPNLKWAQWEMNGWRVRYKHRSKANATMSDNQVRANWNYWQAIYCRLTPSGAKYKDLDGKKQTCR